MLKIEKDVSCLKGGGAYRIISRQNRYFSPTSRVIKSDTSAALPVSFPDHIPLLPHRDLVLVPLLPALSPSPLLMV